MASNIRDASADDRRAFSLQLDNIMMVTKAPLPTLALLDLDKPLEERQWLMIDAYDNHGRVTR